MKKQMTVITGGSSGLGLASARCLAAETTILLGAGYLTGVDILADGGCTYASTVAQIE